MRGLVAVLLVASSSLLLSLTVDPTRATAFTCPPLTTEAQLLALGAPCRSTFIADPGVGNRISRTDFVIPSVFNYYRAQGYSSNFLWYAPTVTSTFPHQGQFDAGVIPWRSCSNPPFNPLTGFMSLCPPAATGAPHVNSTAATSTFHNNGGVNLEVIQWPLGGVSSATSFIGTVCGNFSEIARNGNPVPKISGHKFNDLNGNGVLDGGEPPIAGWTVLLHTPTGHVEPTTTDGSGFYRFFLNGDNFPPGAYTVTESLPPGWVQTGAPGVISVGVGIGDPEFSGNNFLNFQSASLAGTKYEDLNADGNRDAGEPGLDGWTIRLEGTTGQGASVDTAEITDASGAFSFPALAPGTYEVSEDQEVGWIQSEPAGDGDHDVNLESGNELGGLNIGNYRQARIEGAKYDDLNGNGTRDAGEPGLDDWQLNLSGQTGLGQAVGIQTQTGTSGNYVFTGVDPGFYTLSETLQPGWTQSEPASGSYLLSPTSGAVLGNDENLKFGNYVKPVITASKFEDIDEDGVRDPSEPPFVGIKFTLTGISGKGGIVQLTGVTGGGGLYSFVLDPGTYTLCELNTNPTGWWPTLPGQPPNHCYPNLIVQSHDNITRDFGNYVRGSIAGTKFFDHNKNGVRDALDEGLSGWVITLTDCNGGVISSSEGAPTSPGETSSPNPQSTDASGSYSFAGLHNQSYCIEESVHQPWTQTRPCMDPAPACELTVVELLSGQHVTGQDFGNFRMGIPKLPEGNANNVDPLIPAANLWLCLPPALCSGPGEGNLLVTERALNVQTSDSNTDGLDDGLGAYEFSVEYDNFVIQSVNPLDIVFSLGGAGANRGLPVCSFSLVFENVIHFGCATSAPLPAGPTGDFDVARLNLIPHPDLINDIFPGNDNGVVTVLKDNGCELVDVFGHAIIGSINGGLTPICGNLAVTVRILEGDLNLDCVVDVVDQQLISYRFGSFFGSDLYSKWYDLEPNLHDDDVDVKDIQKVFGRDGSTCQDPLPAQPPLPPPAPF
jgi:hypothetical protein